MKTAMQNHIADMKKIQEMIKSKNLDKDLEVTILESIEGCIENAESFLETEKEQILEAYKAGHVDGYELGKHYEDEIYPNSSYYTQTFKSDE